MKLTSKKFEHSSLDASQILAPSATGDDIDLSVEGSNALITFGKKRKEGKASKMLKVKEPVPISKSKMRKLKKLEEEKQQKLMETKSIKLLRKYKIPETAYPLLHSSGTIGQATTAKEKRLREVQFSKAGLEVPEEVSVFKKKCKQEGGEDCHQKDSLDAKKVVYAGFNNGRINSPAATKINYNTLPVLGESESLAASLFSSLPKTTDDIPGVESDKAPLPPSSSFGSNDDTELQMEKNVANVDCQRKETSVEKKANPPIVVRVSRLPEVERTRRELPIIMMEQEIMEAISENSVVILCGETGCGKTTQVPQFLYEAGYGSVTRTDSKGMIGITQPRRVAVLATARRVSYELGLKLGKEVGFQVRHDKKCGETCSIKFMTDGILIRELQSDFLLKRYSVIILDEAHERSLNTDILVGILSRVIQIRKTLHAEQQCSGEKIEPENLITPLKLVLMSATLRVEDFISNKKLFLETPPVVEVPVRQFPVNIHFSKKTRDDYIGQAYKKVMSIHKRLPPGGVLVFVTGQREVELLSRRLRQASYGAKEKKSRTANTGTASTIEANSKEISDAYDIQGKTQDDQVGMLSSLDNEEDHMRPDFDSYDEYEEADSADSDSDDESPEKTGTIMDFLGDAESLSSLKASFDALSGVKNVSSIKETNPHHAEKPRELNSLAIGKLHVLPLYAMLPAAQQLKVFEDVPHGQRLVVVATNVAETSLTIAGIKYVVDTGKEKVKKYNYTTGMATFEVQWISKASAAQRAGRAGRTGPGHCYRLYSSAAFSKDELFPEFSLPEILKTPAEGVFLMMKFMGIDKVANFPFPTPPVKEALVEAERCLKALSALDGKGMLLPLGRQMAQYPMSPRHSRMVLAVIEMLRNQKSYTRPNFVLGCAAAVASALSFSTPFLTQYDVDECGSNELSQEENTDLGVKGSEKKKRLKKLRAVAREARAKFLNPSSDALTIASALQLFELSENRMEFCNTYYLHLKTMEEMSKLRKQLVSLIFNHSRTCDEFSWNHGSAEDVERSWRRESSLQITEEELLRQAICAGWADRVARRVLATSRVSEGAAKGRAARYQSCALEDIVFLHRSSSTSLCPPEYLVYSELLNARKLYIHGVTSVKAEWLVKYAGSLCTFSAPLQDPKPYYEPISDEIYCYLNPYFSRHNWQLPLHSLPIKEPTQRVQLFAYALLRGDVLPCLRAVQKSLTVPPSVVLGPITQRRAGDLVSRLMSGSRMVDSRQKLQAGWSKDPHFLLVEIRNWFSKISDAEFMAIWEKMHREVLLDGRELFPRRMQR